jgi:leucyl-tRNA---protein transferase
MTHRAPLRRAFTDLHPCSYLPGREARMEVLLPDQPADSSMMSWLASAGYRRNGAWHYRPACSQCNACIPTRIPVTRFQPSRSQRRAISTNADLRLELTGVRMDPSRHDLYRRYQAARHPGGEMAGHGAEECLRFLVAGDPAVSRSLEAWDGDRLLGVMVLDLMRDGLSCVYSYYDPTVAPRSLGTYLVLAAVQTALDRRLDWLYLGYRISDCEKMAYKRNFRPRQELIDGTWQDIS